MSIFLAACGDAGVSNGEEQPVEVLESAGVEEPEHGDSFVIETEDANSTVYAYVETGTEWTADEDGDALNVHFEEPGEGGELMLYSIDVDLDAHTLNFYINGESVDIVVYI
ncbi:hypothetical protein [Lacicoccus alkaliphilus]|uniref:Uncharacterized protein n=1 Tax=Lacicoccus alkaliphilus DSM 16010 TaxID=1123231 RepID=A0A1M7EFE1_9BACL|nr:hypothetical protein [Salinicoccus alkaliphilus]SHL90501.1 hypothetical protein SAMN02745189_01207 [Salinicoccus alkaliphilus DSM 16010]